MPDGRMDGWTDGGRMRVRAKSGQYVGLRIWLQYYKLHRIGSILWGYVHNMRARVYGKGYKSPAYSSAHVTRTCAYTKRKHTNTHTHTQNESAT